MRRGLDRWTRTPVPAAFEITERPVDLHAWNGDEATRFPAVLECDVAALIGALASERSTAAESAGRHDAETSALLLSVIEVLDAFERVFANIEVRQPEVSRQMGIWIGNFRTVSRMLGNTLSAYGVIATDSLDQVFDPHWHQIGETLADAARPEGTIVRELKRGYVWHGRVLRKAEVTVVRDNEEPIAGTVSGGDH